MKDNTRERFASYYIANTARQASSRRTFLQTHVPYIILLPQPKHERSREVVLAHLAGYLPDEGTYIAVTLMYRAGRCRIACTCCKDHIEES